MKPAIRKRFSNKVLASASSALSVPCIPGREFKVPLSTRCQRLPSLLITLFSLLLFSPFLAHAQGGSVSCTPQGSAFCSVPVGSASLQNQVVVQAHRSGTVAQVKVLTLGSPSLDFFIPPSPGFSCNGALLAAGTGACSQSIVFTPTFPGLRAGAIVLLDSGGVELGAALLSGTGSAGLGVLVPGNTITVAGVYRDWTSSEDNIPATAANLDQPSSLVFDGAGNLFIADSAHNRIRKVTAPVPPATMGTISTIAGTGDGAYQGDGVPALSTPLNTPSGLAIDGAGNLFIADTLNNRIRKVDAVTGIITTIAGNGEPGSATKVGDGGLAVQANLNQPQGVTVDANGNLYIADTANQRIRRVDAITGLITTVAGDGQPSANGDGKGTYTGDGGPAAQAGLSLPYAVAFDSSGNMYIPDSANNVIRMVNSAGTISTVQMPGGHTLNTPSGVAVDAAGNLYIADTQNSCIRKLDFAAGTLVTLTFNGANVVSPAGIPGSAQIYAPMGLWIDGTGNVYFADFYDMLVEEIQSSVSVLNYTGTPVRQGQQSAPQNQILENDGNLPLTLGSITFDANAAVNAAKSSCPDGSPTLAINSGCLVAAIFAPSAAGDPLLGNIDVDDVSVNPRLDIVLVGNATAVNSTVTTLASNPNPSAFGAPVALAATITTGDNTGNLTGTVSFYDGATLLASQVKVATPSVTVGTTTTTTAGFTTASLAVGTHALTAFYDNTNDPTHFSSTSTPAVNQVVREGTSTVLVSTANPSAIGQNVTFTATVAPSAGGGVLPDGTVTFTDGATTLDTVALTASGTAAFSTATLANGPHAITAAYSGDLAIQVSPSVSASLGQDVLAPSVAVVTSAPNPSSFGNPVTFAVVVTSNGGAVPAGSVALVDGARQIDSMTLDSTTGSGAFTLSSLAVGPHPITASYAGDPYNRSSVSPSITQIVSQAQTATAASANPNPAVVGAEVSISAAVKAIQGVSSPSGTVQFTDTVNGATANLGTVPLSASGTAAISPALAIGAHSIVAAYSGDTNDTPSSSAPMVLVVQQAVTATQIASSPNPSVVDTAANFTASVSGNGGTPTGTVNFFADGLSIGSSTLNAKGIATLAYSGLASGTHAVTATYSGDPNDQASTSSAISQVVGTIPTITALASSGTPGSHSEIVLLSTVVGASGPTPTGSITFTTGTTTFGSAPLNSDGVASFVPNLAVGNSSVVAVYSGDPLHSPSTSPAVSIAGTVTSFAVTVLPASVTIATTQNATVSVGLTSVEGFSDTIGLGCASLPAGVNCHFSSPTVALGSNTTAAAQLIIDTNNPLGGGTSASISSHTRARPFLAGLLLPVCAVFCILFARLRRSSFASLLIHAAFALACTLSLTACNAFTQASASPGTYVIQVTGTGGHSNITQYQNVTIHITK